MPVLFSLLLLAVNVKHNGTQLRAGCAADAEVLSMLPAGAPVTIRYALSGDNGPCYKVVLPSGNRHVEGYLRASAIEGLEEFDQGRRDAEWLEISQAVEAIRASNLSPSKDLTGQATRLIMTSQPAKALQLLDPEIRKRKDPALMALAGLAAWRADDSGRALEFWRGSLDLQPNSEVERLYRRVEREAKNDQSADKIFGTRVLLRYDGASVPAERARAMVVVLDEEFSRISGQLGCSGEERIVAIVQSPEAYRKTVGAAEWSGGQYDGRIRLQVSNGPGADAGMRRALAHEITHACLTMLGGWPAWLHEGLAQKLSGDTLSVALRKKLAVMASQGKLPRLDHLAQDWSRLDAEHAVEAYGLALAAVELFFDNYREYGIANLLRNPERLPGITADLDRRLGL